MLLIFQKFTSHWPRLTKRSSGMLLEPRRSLSPTDYALVCTYENIVVQIKNITDIK